ncbi:hypothetical protein GCM10010489_27080 [Microbacterium saperdae]|nr:hypothetical protein GCM10010489_27080 [Microbacterium saperdae]
MRGAILGERRPSLHALREDGELVLAKRAAARHSDLKDTGIRPPPGCAPMAAKRRTDRDLTHGDA